MEAYGLTALPRAKRADARRRPSSRPSRAFHSREYIDVLRAVSAGELGAARRALRPRARRQPDLPRPVGGRASSPRAARCSPPGSWREGEADRAFHFAGGLHHAMPDRASGFCYVNDAVLAIMQAPGARLARGLRRHRRASRRRRAVRLLRRRRRAHDLDPRAGGPPVPRHRLRRRARGGRRARLLGEPAAPAVHRRSRLPARIRGGGAAAPRGLQARRARRSSSGSIPIGPIRSRTWRSPSRASPRS